MNQLINYLSDSSVCRATPGRGLLNSTVHCPEGEILTTDKKLPQPHCTALHWCQERVSCVICWLGFESVRSVMKEKWELICSGEGMTMDQSTEGYFRDKTV